jgi:hypothetical protein
VPRNGALLHLSASSMEAAFMALLPALVAAVGAAIGAYLAAYAKKKGEALATKEDFQELIRQIQRTTEATEQVKAAIAAQSAIGGELRKSVQELTVSMASMMHSMCWLTWAAMRQGEFTEEKVEQYDDEVHKLSPDIVGHMTSVAALDPAVYEKIEPLVRELFAMDAEIGDACIAWRSNHFDGEHVRRLQSDSVAMMYRLPRKIAGIVGTHAIPSHSSN